MGGGLTCDRLQSLTASCSVAHCSGTSAAFFRAHCQPQAPTRSAAAPAAALAEQGGSVSDLLELGVAGLPAPRCNMARVSMNGDDLGIYVNVEPVKKKFLRENFSDDEGDLYEGTITDFTRAWYSTFESKTDETDETLMRSRTDEAFS